MPTPRPDLESLLPLTPAVFGILLALGETRLHGYGIKQALHDKTAGRERLLPGSLYASIARMLEDGLIEEAPAPAGVASGGPSRRYYRRTPFGRAVATAEAERLQRLVRLARSEKLVRSPSR